MPRSKDLEATQERLSAAVWAVLAERGPAGLTVRAVAERAGCSTGLVLHTFRDKRALLAHARVVLHERTARRADAAETGDDALSAVLLGALLLTEEKRDEARVWVGFLAEALADPALAALHTEYNRAFVSRLERLVTAVRPDWDAGRLSNVAKQLVALVEGLNALAAIDAETYDVDTQRVAIRAALDRALA
ncbi:TetR/AcrR family transcriptional regulator [Cryptosporangium sp. NPDC048952]|uniref:TetR/AcrR family transcriptional regulator n=1 Tax=Cryptosporangium sp. NPDC048952 TaxID=3363961 RepID=UPI00371AA041